MPSGVYKRDKPNSGCFKKGLVPWNKNKGAAWMTKECPYCGDSFKHPRYEKRKYCSLKCCGKAMGFRKGHRSTDETQAKATKARIGHAVTVETREKLRQKTLRQWATKPPCPTGPAHPLWNEEGVRINKRIRMSFKYRQWKSDIFTRDDFTCQSCGRNEDLVGTLEPHRLTRGNSNGKYCPNNILMLCNRCHKEFHGNEFNQVKGK